VESLVVGQCQRRSDARFLPFQEHTGRPSDTAIVFRGLLSKWRILWRLGASFHMSLHHLKWWQHHMCETVWKWTYAWMHVNV
jgi:hypothetical protein